MPNRDPNGDLSASHAFGANLIAMPTLVLFAHPSSADAGGRDAAADLSRRHPSWFRSGGGSGGSGSGRRRDLSALEREKHKILI